jgi:hypothetical protein
LWCENIFAPLLYNHGPPYQNHYVRLNFPFIFNNLHKPLLLYFIIFFANFLIHLSYFAIFFANFLIHQFYYFIIFFANLLICLLPPSFPSFLWATKLRKHTLNSTLFYYLFCKFINLSTPSLLPFLSMGNKAT